MDSYASLDALFPEETPLSAPSALADELPVFADYEHSGSTTSFWCVIA